MKNKRTVSTTRGCFSLILFSSCKKKKAKMGITDHISIFRFFVWGLDKMLSYTFSNFYYEIEKRKTKGRYIHGPGTCAGPRIKTKYFKRRCLPHHKSQRRDIWSTNSPVVSCFLWIGLCPMKRSSGVWIFGDVSVTYRSRNAMFRYRTSEFPVTDYRNRGSGNHTRG